MKNKFQKTAISLIAIFAFIFLFACGKSVNKIKTTSFPLPKQAEKSEIYVEPIPNLPDDFIRGMDASSVLAEEKSGVKYYNFEGKEQDVFMTMAQAGINYFRVRVWNDPYDKDGNGYGGGNNDLQTAIELSKRATKYGMKVCVDFHYSDFWADPKRQHAPKAWEGMEINEKCAALYSFTKESLAKLLDEGVNVAMVQVGNEINNGMSGEKSPKNVMELLKNGSRAVREISKEYKKEILVAVHYTHINYEGEIEKIAMMLDNFKIDYDVFGLSYYPFWDGTIENMQSVAKNILAKHGKKVYIAETSYCYTSENGDGAGNSFKGTDDLVPGYAATVQSQATAIRDICAAANDAGAMGVFYWEGAWLPVGKRTENNSPIWEKYGSGWASSFASDYDPEDAGLYYGGCSWDNQAMFDFEGHPLASLNVFKYLKHGTIAPLKVDYVPPVNISCDVGTKISLPQKVPVVYNNRAENKDVAVNWNTEELAAIDSNKGGKYKVNGTLDDGTKLECNINIIMVNHVKNPSFENSDTSMWKVTYAGDNNPTDFQRKKDDAHSGEVAFHFYSVLDMDFLLEQEFKNLMPGTYQLLAYAQGGDMKKESVLELYAIANGKEWSEPFMVTSWKDWQVPTVTGIHVTDGSLKIGVRMKCNAKSWGTVDDFTLNRIGD